MIPNGWSATQIGDIARFTSGGTPSKQNASFWGGAEPWISGKDLKSHYISNSIDTLTKEGFRVANTAPAGCTLILVRGMTLLKDFPVGYAVRDVAFNQDLKALHPYECIDGLFLSFLLVGEKHKIRQLVSTAGHGTGRLDTESIQSYPVNIPPLPEQQKIAKILSIWDKAISTTEQLLANSQQQKKALMQQLLTGQRRLLDDDGVRFSDDWEEVFIKDILEPHLEYAKDTLCKVYSVTTNGLIDQEEYFNKVVASDDTSKYKIVRKGHFVMSGLNFWMGSVDVYDGNEPVKVSPAYKVFKIKTNFDVFFIKHFIRGRGFKKVLEGASVVGASVVRRNFSIGIFNGWQVSLPSIQEQQKIAAVLSAADQDISTLQQQLATLKQEKKALMQQLLTGKVRVKLTAAEGAN